MDVLLYPYGTVRMTAHYLNAIRGTLLNHIILDHYISVDIEMILMYLYVI
jgi:hypothetical protein